MSTRTARGSPGSRLHPAHSPGCSAPGLCPSRVGWWPSRAERPRLGRAPGSQTKGCHRPRREGRALAGGKQRAEPEGPGGLALGDGLNLGGRAGSQGCSRRACPLPGWLHACPVHAHTHTLPLSGACGCSQDHPLTLPPSQTQAPGSLRPPGGPAGSQVACAHEQAHPEFTLGCLHAHVLDALTPTPPLPQAH